MSCAPEGPEDAGDAKNQKNNPKQIGESRLPNRFVLRSALFAPAALLGGREVARWLKGWQPATILRWSMAATAATLVVFTVYLHLGFGRTWEVQQSEGVEVFAREWKGRADVPRLLHSDSPYALQFHLNTMDQSVSFEHAAEALRSGEPCAVAVRDIERLRELIGADVVLHKIGSCPDSREGQRVVILSNRPG